MNQPNKEALALKAADQWEASFTPEAADFMAVAVRGLIADGKAERAAHAETQRERDALAETATFAGKVFQILDGANIERKQVGAAASEYLGPDQIAIRLIETLAETQRLVGRAFLEREDVKEQLAETQEDLEVAKSFQINYEHAVKLEREEADRTLAETQARLAESDEQSTGFGRIADKRSRELAETQAIARDLLDALVDAVQLLSVAPMSFPYNDRSHNVRRKAHGSIARAKGVLPAPPECSRKGCPGKLMCDEDHCPLASSGEPGADTVPFQGGRDQ